MLRIMSGDLGQLGFTQNNCSLNQFIIYCIIQLHSLHSCVEVVSLTSYDSCLCVLPHTAGKSHSAETKLLNSLHSRKGKATVVFCIPSGLKKCMSLTLIDNSDCHLRN